MRVVLPDNPAQSFFFRRVVVVGTQTPDDLAGFFVQNQDDVGFAAVNDNVVGVEAAVPGVEPLVGAQGGHGVDVHPVAHAGGVFHQGAAAVIGVAAHGVAGLF